jgi:lambda family phage tail tape measure protein
LGDALKKVGIQLIEIAATGFITGAVSGKSGGGSFISNLFSGAGASLFSGGSSLPGSAGASGSSRAASVGPFAKGAPFVNGVLDSPTPFSFNGGKLGVMGEAGPEAIMPLMRAPDGSLGVRTMGASSQQSVHVSVSAGPEFDVMVQQSAAPVAERAVTRNNQHRDSTFNGRVMAANAEREKDFR